MFLKLALQTLILTALCGAGGFLASLIHTPLPYMIGSLVASGLIGIFFSDRLPEGYRFPMKFRMIFMALIGVMIGSRVHADLIAEIPSLIASLTVLTGFVFAAHGVNYVIFRHLGGYDRPTAFYSGTPGGLMESLALGEEAGADIPILTMQQFMRIIAVISIVPLGLSLYYGAPVGSAGGQSMAAPDTSAAAIPLALAIGLAGLFIGTAIKLPAAQLTGPLLAAAIVTVTGLADLALPQWAINLSQVVIGTSLGMRFTGLRGRTMVVAAGLAVVSVTAMLGLGALCATALHSATGAPFDALLISFAPGGVTEMALIALSLHANPAIVTLHHVYRIILTVIEMSVIGRFRRAKQL
ncbi:AbrB family transcriptional regulator [Thalassovita mangrovi]|uniref:AbrB family transcriptional regulator n=1 Tax=Thalassovita mangrovi TaxID=2692236 RepID=A0A6L8LH95_9RHOB|nr:AbrB family transcriptional regulator [Thalassovita mangrovi]MYM54376.1 AbrB family transcriptional regulator [Thalassovita mangrovi]